MRRLASTLDRSVRYLGGPAMVTLLLSFLAWGGWFIYRTSVVLGGRRFFSLFDDAMISMTYARNLVEGYGLNWARYGAPVEGFTSPLWTAVLIPVNALPVALEHRSLIVQLLALAILAGHVVLIGKLVARHFAGPHPAATTALPAAVLTAFYYPFDYWGLMGMETALQGLATTAAVYLALEVVDGRRDRLPGLFAVLALAYLVRMDMALVIAAVLVFLAAHGAIRRDDRRRWLAGFAALALVAGGYQLFRWLYFHDALPNTYYLKMTGIPLEVRLLRGLATFTTFCRFHAVLLLVVGIGCAPWLRRRPKWRLPAALFVLSALYSIYVGGDAWEDQLRANRFLAVAMPQLFVLANALLNELLAAFSRRSGAGRSRAWRTYATAATTALLLLTANGLLAASDAEHNWKVVTVTERPSHVTSHALVISQLTKFKQRVRPRAVVATQWAGIPAYFSNFRMVDLFGYSDRHIARERSADALRPDNFDLYRPGHAKCDYSYVLAEKRPDAFFQAWGMPDEILAPMMERSGYRRVDSFWLRRDSSRVRR